MWLRPKARKAGRRQGDRALRKTTATGFVVEQSSPPQTALNDTPNPPLLTSDRAIKLAFPGVKELVIGGPNLDLARAASQTRSMAHAYGIYIRFDFGTDEEKAQQARHKLEGWRQAFRLDKRVQYKMDRPGNAVAETASKPAPTEKPAASAKGREKPAAKGAKAAGKSSEPAASKAALAKSDGDADGKVGLLVRLYFSPHEKLSEQRWLSRIPAEEPFKSASPKVINHDDPEFEATDQQFEAIPVGEAGGRTS